MKINLKLDVSKIEKDKIKPRTYTNKEGVDVTTQDLDLELVELKEKKLIKEGDTWIMYKTHFVAHPSVKNADGTYNNGSIIGDGITFEDKSSAPQATAPAPEYPEEEINPEDIPF